MPTAYLSLGSNLGDRAANLRDALERLNTPSCHVLKVSSFYETIPVGETPEPVPLYLNCAAQVETDLPPLALLQHTQSVEQAGGRVPTFRWGPRLIDIDVLHYNEFTCDTERLTLPHPRLFERAFALLPLSELSPDLVFPDGTTLRRRLTAPVVQEQEIKKLQG